MRQVAWLASVPSSSKGNNKNLTNAKLWKNEEVPEVTKTPEMLEWFFELGTCSGKDPLTFQEMKSWSELTGTYLIPWAYKTLRKMSASYVAQMNRSIDIKEPRPFLSLAKKKKV